MLDITFSTETCSRYILRTDISDNVGTLEKLINKIIDIVLYIFFFLLQYRIFFLKQFSSYQFYFHNNN